MEVSDKSTFERRRKHTEPGSDRDLPFLLQTEAQSGNPRPTVLVVAIYYFHFALHIQETKTLHVVLRILPGQPLTHFSKPRMLIARTALLVQR